MKRFFCVCLLVGITSILALCQSDSAGAQPQAAPQAHESKATVEGLVRDIACPIQNLEATATHLSMKCLVACARKGSPLVILTNNGDLYLPISAKMPDEDQRPALMPFLGKYVQATGTVYERNGTRVIVISEIKERKDVSLTIEGQ